MRDGPKSGGKAAGFQCQDPNEPNDAELFTCLIHIKALSFQEALIGMSTKRFRRFFPSAKGAVMSGKFIPVFASIAMIAGLPSYSFAGWGDNVPHDFVPQSHHRMRQYKERQYQERQYREPSAAPRTNGSVKYTPRRPAVRRSVQPGTNY